jgi:hypothetical protein
MQKLISAMLIIVGIIHLLPLSGVLGSARLTALYGLDFSHPDLAILMRHRAVLFGLLGLFLIAAAFRPAWQGAALIGGLVSVLSFLWLAWSTGGYGAPIARVVAADLVALLCLAVAGAALLWLRSASS